MVAAAVADRHYRSSSTQAGARVASPGRSSTTSAKTSCRRNRRKRSSSYPGPSVRRCLGGRIPILAPIPIAVANTRLFFLFRNWKAIPILVSSGGLPTVPMPRRCARPPVRRSAVRHDLMETRSDNTQRTRTIGGDPPGERHFRAALVIEASGMAEGCTIVREERRRRRSRTDSVYANELRLQRLASPGRLLARPASSFTRCSAWPGYKWKGWISTVAFKFRISAACQTFHRATASSTASLAPPFPALSKPWTRCIGVAAARSLLRRRPSARCSDSAVSPPPVSIAQRDARHF